MIIEKSSKLLLYDINGNLKETKEIPFTKEAFYFLDNDKIAVLKSRRTMNEDGDLIYIYNINLDRKYRICLMRVMILMSDPLLFSLYYF